MENKGLPVEYSLTTQYFVVFPKDLNAGNRLYGGVLLEKLDLIAGIVAMRHCGTKRVTTAAIDNLVFKCGAFVNDLVVLNARVTYTGNTSIEVRVDTYVEDQNGLRRSICRVYFVLVAMDEEGNKLKVPPLIIQTESEKAEWEGALLRKQNRLDRRKAGF